MKVLLTGGAGYIGSHTAVSLSQGGHDIVILDNFFNSNKVIIESLQEIVGKSIPCIAGDIRDTNLVIKVLEHYQVEAIIHFAGLKAVGESVSDPIKYYANNVQGSISILQAMQQVGIYNLVFSSSATVYGEPKYLPYDEAHPTDPVNPYGHSKLQTEQIFRDMANSDPRWRIISLRYFNPVGAHESGLIGEDPSGHPNNLMPYIVKVALNQLPYLNIFGQDYETRDGTGERDYIHVMDLADGHLKALSHLKKNTGFMVFNLGTGRPTSVLELVRAFEKESGLILSFKFTDRRPGDMAVYYADPGSAMKRLNWIAKRSLIEICASTWLREKKKMIKI